MNALILQVKRLYYRNIVYSFKENKIEKLSNVQVKGNFIKKWHVVYVNKRKYQFFFSEFDAVICFDNFNFHETGDADYSAKPSPLVKVEVKK